MDELITTTNNQINELCESLKLTKNSKGYNWEISLKTKGLDIIDSKFIERLNKINIEMFSKFGSESN